MSNANRDGRSLRAARWALENGASLSEAAEKFDCTKGATAQTFRRMFPDVPSLVGRRAGSDVQSWPEDEVSL